MNRLTFFAVKVSSRYRAEVDPNSGKSGFMSIYVLRTLLEGCYFSRMLEREEESNCSMGLVSRLVACVGFCSWRSLGCGDEGSVGLCGKRE